MRLKNLILGDIKFQFKYGFYFLYLFLSIIYICIINVFPTFMREKIAIIMIYSDPAAMGLFFMGAIVLLEKSQRVLNINYRYLFFFYYIFFAWIDTCK